MQKYRKFWRGSHTFKHHFINVLLLLLLLRAHFVYNPIYTFNTNSRHICWTGSYRPYKYQKNVLLHCCFLVYRKEQAAVLSYTIAHCRKKNLCFLTWGPIDEECHYIMYSVICWGFIYYTYTRRIYWPMLRT